MLTRWPLMAEASSEAATGAQGAGGAAVAVGSETTPAVSTGTSDGGNLLDWRSSLPPELRDDPVIKNTASTLTDAAKSFIHAQRLIGKSVQIPGEDATPDVLDKFYAKLGRPATPNDYTFEAPELPDGVVINKEFETQLREFAHANGLNGKQAQGLLELAARQVRDAHNMKEGQQAQSYADGQKALQRTFGASAPRVVQEAQMFFEQIVGQRFGGEHGPKAMQKLVEAGLANDVDIVAVFSNATKMLMEGEFLEASQWGGSGVTSREALEARRAELVPKQFDPTFSSAEKEELSRIYQQLAALDAGRGRR